MRDMYIDIYISLFVYFCPQINTAACFSEILQNTCKISWTKTGFVLGAKI